MPTYSKWEARIKWVHRDNDKWQCWGQSSVVVMQNRCPPAIQEGVLQKRQVLSAGHVSAPYSCVQLHKKNLTFFYC